MEYLDFLPVTREDMQARGWNYCDFVIVSGDAYVDHPSFGHALIARVLEAQGFKVCILAQPDWHSCADFKRFGRPRLGFLIAAGNIDSMVNHYTAARKPRSGDVYSPGGQGGLRPDRATIVYTNRAREAYRNVFIGIGGVEASLRRFAHYDYWDDAVRRSILVDSGADILLYGMAERSVRELAARLNAKKGIEGIPGTCILTEEPPQGVTEIPSFMQVKDNKREYAQAFAMQYREQDPVRGKALCQRHERQTLVQYPPALPLDTPEMDEVYALPFMRACHPSYAQGVPALEEVQFSITNTRGCYGECAFCALTFHQGRIVHARTTESVVKEAKIITGLPGFKGYIHDVGGPTANFTRPSCDKQLKHGTCRNRQCLSPEPCPKLVVDHRPLLKTLRAVRKVQGVRKVFVRSGLRYDAIMLDRDDEFLRELCEHHISGQLKVAPEHVSPRVLRIMRKPGCGLYFSFVDKYQNINRQIGKNQFLVPYFISSHPGCGLREAVELAEYLRDIGHQPEQVQDFYPTPGTLATAMFHTGLDPLTLQSVYIPKDREEKAMQRALLQYKRPQNRELVRQALRKVGREDLIGYGGRCLVPPGREEYVPQRRNGPAPRPGRPTQPGMRRGRGSAPGGRRPK